MTGKTRTEILEAIRGAGVRNSRLEFMRICSAHPIDFATANHAFLEGREAALGREAAQSSASEPDVEIPTGAYAYDFGACAIARGWAKFSSIHDGVHFGNWASPTELKWVNYRDGEAKVMEFRRPEEFVKFCRATFARYEQHDGQSPSLEIGFNKDLKAELIRLGLGDMLSTD